MNPNETAIPPPGFSLPPGFLGRRSSCPEEKALGPEQKFHDELRVISIRDLDCEPLSVEIFKEELSYRAQDRRFLWEFFD